MLKPSKKSPSKEQPKKRSKYRWAYISGCVIVVLIGMILYDLYSPLFGGQIRFYRAWQDCGALPYQEDHAFPIAFYRRSHTFELFRNNRMQYFCTEKEAEFGGFSASASFYDTPHLTPEESQNRFNH